jgi:hypothetical protein
MWLFTVRVIFKKSLVGVLLFQKLVGALYHQALSQALAAGLLTTSVALMPGCHLSSLACATAE